MIKRTYILLVLLIAAALVISACGGGSAVPETAPEETEPAAQEEAPAEEAAEAPAEEPTAEAEEAAAPEEPAEMAHRYGQVTDVGGIDDKSFNQLAWIGMERAAEEFGVDVQFLESQQQTDYEKNINEFITQDYNGIITVGFLLADATRAASESNPDLPFVIVDSPSETPGTVGILSNIAEPSFLAGYLAAGMSETGTVCTYGGIKIPPVTAFMVGFEHGVMYYNEQKGTDVQVLGWQTDPASEGGGDGSFTGNFESLDDGRSFAENFFDEGCDIILPVAGPVGLGSAAAAQDRGFMVIGVDADQTQTAPEFSDVFLTSILKKIDVGIVEQIRQIENGTFEGGINFFLTLANEGLDLAPFHEFEDAVPQELRDELAAVEQGVIDGSISTGWPVGPVEAAETEAEEATADEEEAAEEAAAEEEAMAEEGEAMAAPAPGELGSEENPINVLFVPSVDAGVIVSGGEVMAQALNDATGLSFNVEVPTSYAATIEAMCASPEDTIGFIPALGYVLANNRCDVEVGAAAVRRGLSWYAAQILVPRDSEAQTIEDLADAQWAVPDLGSTSGYLYPSVMLQEAGVEPSEVVEAGGHGQSVLAVYNGEVDFSTSFFSPPDFGEEAETWQYGQDDPEPFEFDQVNEECVAPSTDPDRPGDVKILDARCTVLETAPDVFERTRILMLSQQIPNDTMSFSPEFPQDLKQVIVDAMVEFAGSEACTESICSEDFYSWTGMEPVDDEFYDPVRSLINILGYTEEDIFGN